MNLTNAQLRATLPAGITLDAAAYPDASTAMKVLSDFLEAVFAAQTAQNVGAAAGQAVQSVSAGIGASQTIVYPPGSGTTVAVTPRVFTVTVLRESAITNTYPVLG